MSGCFGLGCLLLPVCCRAASRRESGPNNIAEEQVAGHDHEYLYTGGNARVKSVTNRLRFTFHPSRFTFPGRCRRVWCLLAGAVGDRESSRRGLRSRPIVGLATAWLGPRLGILVGKLAADVIFYGPVIAVQELRLRRAPPRR